MPPNSKSKDKATSLKNRAQRCMLQLRQEGLTPKDIEMKLGGLISWRTLYRWMNGEITPKSSYGVVALEKLLVKDQNKKHQQR